MSGRKTATLLPIIAALAIVALTLYAYRSLPARLFAADDYQWLLGVQGLGFGQLMRRAFDPTAQTHFYRPLIWLLFWAQTRAFGLDPRGFHTVSLALHLLNAALLGWLAYRLAPKWKMENRELKSHALYSIFNPRFLIPVLAMAIVALHPAPFEAVVWISAQSELLAAALLLLALHLWLPRQRDKEIKRQGERASSLSVSLSPNLVVATFALGLALLAKESAVIGLPLLMMLGQGTGDRGQGTTSESPGTTIGSSGITIGSPGTTIGSPGTTSESSGTTSGSSGTKNQGLVPGRRFEHLIYTLQSTITPYVLPALVTLAYIALQVIIERRNYLLQQGGYGLGGQVVLNPLRSLALLVAPMPGTEHADATWLVPLGGLVAAVLLGFWILAFRFWMRARWNRSSVVGRRSSVVVPLALGLTLLPTAPFASPPDSRYLYLPVMAGALLLISTMDDRRSTMRSRDRRSSVLFVWMLALALAWWAAGELHAREGRFAAASGPGGSLWQVASWACQASRPERVAIVEPPLAAPHVEAIIGLACGADVRAKIVGSDQVAGAIKGRTLVLAFPNGSAEVQRWP